MAQQGTVQVLEPEQEEEEGQGGQWPAQWAATDANPYEVTSVDSWERYAG